MRVGRGESGGEGGDACRRGGVVGSVDEMNVQRGSCKPSIVSRGREDGRRGTDLEVTL